MKIRCMCIDSPCSWVLAHGAAADLSMLVYNDEAQLYDQLARTALSLRSVFEGT